MFIEKKERAMAEPRNSDLHKSLLQVVIHRATVSGLHASFGQLEELTKQMPQADARNARALILKGMQEAADDFFKKMAVLI